MQLGPVPHLEENRVYMQLAAPFHSRSVVSVVGTDVPSTNRAFGGDPFWATSGAVPPDVPTTPCAAVVSGPRAEEWYRSIGSKEASRPLRALRAATVPPLLPLLPPPRTSLNVALPIAGEGRHCVDVTLKFFFFSPVQVFRF